MFSITCAHVYWSVTAATTCAMQWQGGPAAVASAAGTAVLQQALMQVGLLAVQGEGAVHVLQRIGLHAVTADFRVFRV